LNLSPHYTDLLLEPEALPFSVLPDAPIDRTTFFGIMRDTMAGTEFDLSKVWLPDYLQKEKAHAEKTITLSRATTTVITTTQQYSR
jgi:hypothetical protein